jgi:predicted transcriptional regulator of viral defense system
VRREQYADNAVTLWAGPGSAISHESALAVYGLASAMPAAIHLTAPRSFQGRRAGDGSTMGSWQTTNGGCGMTCP